MKTKILAILATAAALWGTTACNDDWAPQDKAQGRVALSSLAVEVDTDEPEARASVDVSNYLIDITDAKDEIQGTWTYTSMPEVVTLAVGDYTLRVRSHAVEAAAWNAPYYTGTKTFTVKENGITDIGTVRCTFQSIKVTIIFADDIRAKMGSDVQVDVKAGANGHLVFTPQASTAADAAHAGYFEAVDESTTLVAVFKGTIAGNTENLRTELTDVKAGQHRRITFSLKSNSTSEIPDESGSASFTDPSDPSASGVTIDASWEIDPNDSIGGNASLSGSDENINGGERPGKEDPVITPDPGTDPNPGTDPGTDPTPSTDPADVIHFVPAEGGMNFTAPNTSTSMNGAFDIIIDNGLADLDVSIASTNDEFAGIIAVMQLTSFNLVSPGDAEEALQGFGFPTGTGLVGSTKLAFDISEFIPLLGNYAGTHTFTFTVTDKKGLTLPQELVFTITK